MVEFTFKENYTVEDLVEIVRILRAPGGCPWDGEQTHQSIRRNFIEETLEACEAIDQDDPVLLQEELGDVLMQVIFHAGIEQDAGRFTLDDAADTACKKLIFRHPHVFGSTEVSGSDEVLVNWEELKRQEKGQDTYTDTLDAVARSLPGMWRAEKLQKKAAKCGFQWEDAMEAMGKLEEEVSELGQVVYGEESGDLEDEIGDVLFSAVNVARMSGLDPEDCLRRSCEKFIGRFRRMEEAAEADLSRLDREALLTLWQQAKE